MAYIPTRYLNNMDEQKRIAEELWGLDKQFDFIIGWNGCQLYDDKKKKLYKSSKCIVFDKS